jgi:GT2 family glycosyltransferase
MNTIPTTTKRPRTPYTVVGGSRSLSGGRLPKSLSILLLNRGGRPYKSAVFSDLIEIGATEILSVEGPGAQYDIEALSKKHPEVRFLLLARQVTTGERINLGIEEAKGEYVLVLWNDMHLDSGLSVKLFESITAKPTLCVVPALYTPRREIIPTVQVPAMYRRQLKVVPTTAESDDVPTIFPFDYCGIYRKEQFALTGGYDYLLGNPYWQKLDFGFRAFLWGERLCHRSGFRLRYLSSPPTDDTSRDLSYKLFFLKNLAVRFNRDVGKLPWGQLFGYLLRSGGDVYSAWREWREVANWVRINQFRFKQEARDVAELWEMTER